MFPPIDFLPTSADALLQPIYGEPGPNTPLEFVSGAVAAASAGSIACRQGFGGALLSLNAAVEVGLGEMRSPRSTLNSRDQYTSNH